MRKIYIFLLLSLLILIMGCTGGNETTDEIDDIRGLVHYYSTEQFDEDVTASITSHELVVTKKGEEKVYDLSEEDFFVSIAPFKTTTHECAIHSLTGCQGELIEETLHAYIEDDQGEVIIDEEMTTLANGFIDLWLPRERTYTVKFTQDDYEAEGEISTFKDDYTCITTMQLNKS